MDDFNFTNAAPVIAAFANLLLEVCFRKIDAFAYCHLSGRCQLLLLSQNCFKQLLQQNLTDNFISPYAECLKHFILARFVLIEGYGKRALRKCTLRRSLLLSWSSLK